ncbi:MAG TPA: glycosyltransferase [Planctomycetota bacterium]
MTPGTEAPQPEVAVAIPCHGYARFLPDAVQSVAMQTWQNLHVVIVDDGSPDDTAAVAAALVARFPERRIEVLRQANQGLAAARNAGIRRTQSPFVLPLDADDRLAPNAIERLVQVLQESGADVATPFGRTFGDEDRRLVTRPVTRRRLSANNCLLYASLVRRSVFDSVGGYRPNAPGYEDWDFWLSALEQGARFVHVPEELFLYRKHGPTMLAAADRNAMQLHATIACLHPKLFSKWRSALATRLLREGRHAGLGLRLGMLLTFLADCRLKVFWRQALALRPRWDLRRMAKQLVLPFRQYLGRTTVADRHIRGAGIEIGAMQDPLPVRRGVKVRYVDWLDTEALRAMHPNKDSRHIVEVDIVDDGERLAKVGNGTQGFVIANHFLEHCEDPIGTLFNLLRVVQTDGVVFLSIPDKRHMFDRDRQSTTIDHLVRDHEQGPEVSRQAHYEDVVRLGLKVQGEAAVATAVQELVEQKFRIHFHCWTQTDFLQLLCNLQTRPGFPRFDIVEFVANEREMVVVLRRLA